MAEVNHLNTTAVSVPEALQLVSQFFDKEWPETREEDVQLVQMTNGYSSTVYAIHRSTPAVNEPSSLILRQRKGYFSMLQDILLLSEAEQGILFYENGQRGWGPKLYGIGNGVRVEEFIPARTLTPKDCADPEILSDLARSYARFHSLNFPFQKRKNQLVAADMILTAQAHKGNQEELIETFKLGKIPDTDYLVKKYFSLDYEQEIKWITRLHEENRCKVLFCHGDPNFLNILVRDEECMGDNQVVLLDYELAGYECRGFDLGGHFVNRMVDWRGKDHKRSGLPYPSEEERRKFCALYLHHIQEMGHLMEDVDTVDHLMLEGELGALLYCLNLVTVCVKYLSHLIKEPSFLTVIRLMFDLYVERKKNFIN